jgi:hypothetical protein
MLVVQCGQQDRDCCCGCLSRAKFFCIAFARRRLYGVMVKLLQAAFLKNVQYHLSWRCVPQNFYVFLYWKCAFLNLQNQWML